ncbi:ATP-grasp fold amidoligase family protein [Marinimicrobium sp. ABcell2]|uniref:ATP-grasp fold amidoligase family protein n=1 Tax=Marinimicrobium sp. ABcell2 TaxID=3069751 RepID=UPI0027B63E60|nr:ATP-grasp fold amidoligase family protein [Marinimicrobium sp. ABcell2]MDQ2078332.1 ATP-grasp fold amidoligase family protein [Marinimicrobium sp. ABcell2]
MSHKLVDQINQVRSSFKRIEEEYQVICEPIRAIRKAKILPPEVSGVVEEIRNFKFYPKLTHVPNAFFEKSQSHSYRLQRAAQIGVINRSKELPPRVISNKTKGALFAKRVGLRTPDSTLPVPLEKVEFTSPRVIKPLHSDGGNCVYAIQPAPDGTLINRFSGKTYESVGELKDSIRNHMAKVGVSKDIWLQEEMIVGSKGDPTETMDVKFYTFYGRVALVLQVDRWRGKKYRFFDAEGTMVNTGKYSADGDMTALFDKKLVKLASEISLKIPWPHIRIDFLVSDTDFRFGEFTCQPGQASMFNTEWDSELGKCYVEAQSRLYEDFIKGKQFTEYNEIIK